MTILSTTVFQRMCTVDPAVRSALRPCRRRLVSVDSSPLIVQGQLELDIVFPGLCCNMLFVVATLEMLDGGQIEPNDSPWASPLF